MFVNKNWFFFHSGTIGWSETYPGRKCLGVRPSPPTLDQVHQRELVSIVTCFWSTSRLGSWALMRLALPTPVETIVDVFPLRSLRRNTIWEIRLPATCTRLSGMTMCPFYTNNWEPKNGRWFSNAFFYTVLYDTKLCCCNKISQIYTKPIVFHFR